MSDDLLSGFGPDERSQLRRVLEDEEAKASEPWQPQRKPTDEELIAAGWKRPLPPPPTEAGLIQELREFHTDAQPREWAGFWDDADDVLLALHEREPRLLRHKVTKKWGHMWRLAEPDKGEVT